MNEEYTRGLIIAKSIILHSTSLKHALDSVNNTISQSRVINTDYLKEE